MKNRQRIIFLLIALILPAIIFWLGEQYIELSGKRLREQSAEELQLQAQSVTHAIQNQFNQLAQKLDNAVEEARGRKSRVSFLELVNPDIEQLTILSANNKIIYPALPSSLDQRQLSYYLALKEHVKAELVYPQQANAPLQQALQSVSSEQSEQTNKCGWSSIFWQDGIAIQYCHRTQDGSRYFIRTPKLRLLANIKATIRQSLPKDIHFSLYDFKGDRMVKSSASKNVKTDNANATRTIPLPRPLSAWRLQLAVKEKINNERTQVYLICGLAVLLSWLILGILYVWLIRSLMAAAQRVSFVNRVSHELKTPLTNIRLYAELLEDSEIVTDDSTRRKLEVITTESARLSRLINNILTFSRQQRQAIKLHYSSVHPDDIIKATVEKFSQSLIASRIDIRLDLNVTINVRLDPDALEQILINLLSNSEKYAPESRVTITSVIKKNKLHIDFSNTGPAIPYAKRNTIFAPFSRLSTAVNEGTSGSGIGLSISRELARMQGGDLILHPSESGVAFQLTIPADVTTEKEKE